MFVNQLCWSLLLAFICVSFADESEDINIDAATSSEDGNITLVSHLSGTCASDGDCFHLGKCVSRADGKFCECKNGTSGELCEKVDECVDNPLKCGTLDDVSCIFDVEEEKAVCKCQNESKTYVKNSKRCRSPCSFYQGCGKYGSCLIKYGDKTFCACQLGASGDFCEIIDKCHNKTVDCGTDNNATCLLGGEGEAYCKCDDIALGFDYDAKICKDCSGCGKNVYKEIRCEFTDGKRICLCKSRYYSNENGVCEDCKCGQGSYGCELQNGTKLCQCWGGYAPKNGRCEICNCGSKATKCEYMNEKKICTCQEGLISSAKYGTGTCVQMCNTTSPCQNGGTCNQNICSCQKGTSGDLCQKVDDCFGDWKCGSADCLYNVTSHESYCHCKSPSVFDETYKRCKECDCGRYGRKCTFVSGEKKCDCEGMYEDRLGTCALCYCKGPSSMYGCKFDKSGDIVCPCFKGYAQLNDECKTCDCGDHGKCKLYGPYSKSCKCDEGYIEDRGMCKECDCSKNGYCSFDGNGKKLCSCHQGYKEFRGTCKECLCGPNSNCQLDSYGNKNCTCVSGYGKKNGFCTRCDCYPGTSCKFAEGPYEFTKICECPDKYANYKGACQACDCGVKGSKCTLSLGFRDCVCPEGYKVDYKFMEKICKDIDECLNSYACPSGTKCVNTPGSYDCVCKDGYEQPPKWRYDKYDIKKDGCIDIDECVRESRPCTDKYATCVNTPGSYKCECMAGYYAETSYSARYTVCYQETRPWRIASIVIGCVAGIIIIGLLIGIYHKHG